MSDRRKLTIVKVNSVNRMKMMMMDDRKAVKEKATLMLSQVIHAMSIVPVTLIYIIMKC